MCNLDQASRTTITMYLMLAPEFDTNTCCFGTCSCLLQSFPAAAHLASHHQNDSGTSCTGFTCLCCSYVVCNLLAESELAIQPYLQANCTRSRHVSNMTQNLSINDTLALTSLWCQDQKCYARTLQYCGGNNVQTTCEASKQ